MQRLIFFLLATFLVQSIVWSQPANLNWTSLNAGGKNQISSGGIKLSQTIGQMANGYLKTTNVGLTQGFQQAFSSTVSSSNILQLASRIQLFPNPTSDQVKLDFFIEKSELLDLEILDVLGKRQDQGQPRLFLHSGRNQITLSLAHLPNGQYWLRLKGANRQSTIPLQVLH